MNMSEPVSETKEKILAGKWEDIAENSGKWWDGTLGRPLIQIRLSGRETGRPEPELLAYQFTSFYDDSVSAEAIVDRWDYDLSCVEYLGDAFPAVWPNFGPGVLAAMCGAVLENGEETVWFHPREPKEIADTEIAFNPDNRWTKRIGDIMAAAMERWQGSVQVGMTDLGGSLDILSAFRPSEELLFDLYDDPEAVKEKNWTVHEEWFKAFEYLNNILQPVNPGYTAWAPIFSSDPFYMLQCDFSYMIGPDMFDEFVLPELAASCKKLVNPFYHLDGPGELPHLDSLLAIPELKGVQWVPGAGEKPISEWPEVYSKIISAGKRTQIHGIDMGAGRCSWEVLDLIAEQAGAAAPIVIFAEGDISQRDDALRFLEKYNAV